jgi:hypothetical protein
MRPSPVTMVMLVVVGVLSSELAVVLSAAMAMVASSVVAKVAAGAARAPHPSRREDVAGRRVAALAKLATVLLVPLVLPVLPALVLVLHVLVLLLLLRPCLPVEQKVNRRARGGAVALAMVTRRPRRRRLAEAVSSGPCRGRSSWLQSKARSCSVRCSSDVTTAG